MLASPTTPADPAGGPAGTPTVTGGGATGGAPAGGFNSPIPFLNVTPENVISLNIDPTGGAGGQGSAGGGANTGASANIAPGAGQGSGGSGSGGPGSGGGGSGGSTGGQVGGQGGAAAGAVGNVRGSAAGSDGGDATGAGQLGTGGISISLDTAPSGNLGSGLQGGVVTVSVPKAMATAGSGFSFELPAQVRDSVGTGAVQATQADGNPLPGWIKFNSATQRFEAGIVPDQGLPLQVMISTGTTQVLVVISERAE